MPWIHSLLLLLGAQVVRAWDHVSESESARMLEIGDPILVAFVKPDEPSSAALEQEWLSATSQAAEGQQLVSVDCSAPEADCEIQEGMSYPSIFLMELDQPLVRYQGPRRAAAFLNFMSRKARPVASEVLHAEALSAFKKSDETVFVAYLDSSDYVSAVAFADIAWKYRDEFSFGTVFNAEVAEAEDIESPSVVCYKPLDEDTVVLKEVNGVEELEKWVKETSRGVLGDLAQWNRQRLLDRGSPMVYLFGSTEAERRELREALSKFAKNYYETLTSVVVDPFEFPDLMGQLGLEPDVFPAGAVHQISKDRIYPYPKGRPFDPKAVQQWGLDVYQGRIKPWTPPGATSTYEESGPTRIAVQKMSMRTIPGVKIKIAGHDEL